MGSKITHVANASEMPIRVYYSTDKMRLEELVMEVNVRGEATGIREASQSTKMIFKADSRVRFILIPAKEFGKIIERGPLYVTVFLESNDSSNECLKSIAENFCIPNNRSFIVTKKGHIKLQELGENIWVDEDGIKHKLTSQELK